MSDELVLRGQVCFALYTASRALTDVYRPILAEFGLTYPQYLVLLVLWETEQEQPPTVSGLGTQLHLDSGTLSPLLKRLEAAGLVVRRRSAADERRVAVELTPAGRTLRGRMADVPRRMAQATGLGADDLVELRDTLTRITRTIHQHKEQ